VSLMSFAAPVHGEPGFQSRCGSRRWTFARQYGLYSVAHPLRLDYAQLKKRLGGVVTVSRKASSPAFVELIASHSVSMSECVIEFESSIGSKMRIQWKGASAPDWARLLRAWRESER